MKSERRFYWLFNTFYVSSAVNHAPCAKDWTPCTKPYALCAMDHGPCTMHACKSYLVLKISPKLASGYVPRYGPLYYIMLRKGFTIWFSNNKTIYYLFFVYAFLIYKTRFIYYFNISLRFKIWYYIFIANIKAFKLKAKIFKIKVYLKPKSLYNGFIN